MSSIFIVVLAQCILYFYISRHRQGKRCGKAKYIWADGSIEISSYDEDGIQNGPAKLTWPNGAIREGSKVN